METKILGENENVSHVSSPITSPEVNSYGLTKSLILNIIPFTPLEKEKEFSLYLKWKEGLCPIHKDDLRGQIESLVEEDDLEDGQWLYSDFAPPKAGAIVVKVDLTKSIYFAQHYYRHLIRNYFTGVADVIRKNFTNEVEVWFHDSSINSGKYKVYNQFTLKVQHGRVTDGPELVVSYDGTSKILNKSIAEMGQFDYSKINWMNCDGELHQYKNMPERYKLIQHKLFPVLSNKLKPQLGVAFDIPDFRNRYPKYRNLLNEFYSKHLDNEKFRNVIPLSLEGFMKAPSGTLRRISNSSNELEFGRGLGKQPKTDMRRLGPCKPIPPPNNVRFFFIYQENLGEYAKLLYTHLTKGFYGKDGRLLFPKMQEFINQPFFIEDADSLIKFSSMNTAVKTVKEAISKKEKKPNTRYMAIYVSPYSRINVPPEHKQVYNRIKEMLLYEGITSQVIYAENIKRDNFNYYLPNIEIATLAKLGGTPWRLNRSLSNELIVGVGAFYSVSKKTKYVASAFCFDNTGKFQGFDCFQSNETNLLAGSIRKAVMKFFIDHGEHADRLIIHFYKVMGKKELKPIKDMLHKLQLDIPVIIVTINKTESKELLGFDMDSPQLMPYSGTYVKTGRQEYLLFNNTRYDIASKPTEREYHFPIKLHIASTRPELLDNPDTIEELIDEVYQFSRMYWKSVGQQSLPVTIKYPEMVAKIFPWFQYDTLPEFGKTNLWFL